MRRAIVIVALVIGCREKSAPKKHESPPPPTVAVSTTKRTPPTLTLASAFVSSVAASSNTPAAWTAIADTYQAELASCTANCRDTAYAIVLARKNAVEAAQLKPPPVDGPVDGPVELPPEVQAKVDALDQYVKMLDPTDDEVAPMQFLAANTLWRWRQPEALTRLQKFLEEHRDDATAEYAANQLLHSLMEQGRMDELRAWVAEFSADETFLANKPELRATLERIREVLAANP